MKNIIQIVIFLIPFFSFSQIKINGNLINNNKPVPFSNVVLYDQSNTIVNGVVTDLDGFFELSAQAGIYKLTITNTNYQSIDIEIVLDKDLTLNDIVLVQKENVLTEVVVQGSKQRITRKIDRLVFNIENSPIADTGTAFDALKVSPGLILKNDEIAMLGKSGVRVMVDGKMIQLSGQELSSFLNTISANNIKAIEIIANPPAKYEAAGNSGIINILLKKSKKNAWSNNTSFSNTQARYGSSSLDNSFSYQKNKISSLLSLRYNFGYTETDERINVDFTSGRRETRNISKIKINNLSGLFLFGYEINKTSKINIQYMGGIRNNNSDSDITTNIFNNQNSIDSFLKGDGFLIDKNKNQTLNLNFSKQLDTLGRSMSIDFDVLDYNTSRNNNNISSTYSPPDTFSEVNFANESDGDQKVKNYNTKIDFENPTKYIKLSYGAQFSFSKTVNNVNNFDLMSGDPILIPSQSFQFQFNENIQSAYISGAKKINERWETQIGLRTEYTQTKGISEQLNQLNQLNEREYIKFFPTVFLSYKRDDNNTFAFNYGKRVNRPSYNQLNPARFYLNSQSYSVGNPFLKPSYNNTLEFKHIFKDNLTTKFSLNTISNGYNKVNIIDDANNVQILTSLNFFTNYSYALTETYHLKMTDWWDTDNTLFFNYSVSKKTNNLVGGSLRSGPEFYGSINNFLTLNKSKSIIGEVNFWYDSPYNDNLYKLSDAYSLDLAFRFKSLIKNFNFTAGFYDVFNSSRRHVYSEVNGIKQSFILYPSNRYFKVTLSYRFGNDKISTRQRKFGNEDIRNRSN